MIPARIGSTRFKMKNLALLNGKPMIAYAIMAALSSNIFDRVIVNSDSEVFRTIAEKYGAEFYLRPEQLGGSSVKSDVVVKDFIEKSEFPLAVRSSSLLEDSQYQPLAGMYATYMLPNSHEKKKERLSQLCEAIKRVFASTYFQDPKTMMDNIVQKHEDEKMAIIIMEMIGKRHDNTFYPSISGVAQSFNYYPVSHMKRNQGVAFIALGLGRTIADGERCLRCSPTHPTILPQFYSIESTIENSQNYFYALELKNGNNPIEKEHKFSTFRSLFSNIRTELLT